MHTLTLRFLAPHNGAHAGGRVSAGTVLNWVDEAGFACASAWAHADCVIAFLGNTHFLRPVRPGELVEVGAHLAYTGENSMGLAIEVHAGALGGNELHAVVHCGAVYVALDSAGAVRPVERFTPETPGDIALAQRVRAQIAAAQASQ